MIKAVIFDFDSTLVDYHYSDDKAIEEVVALLSTTIDYSDFLNTSGIFIEEAFDNGLVNGEDIQKYRLTKTLNHYGHTYNDLYLKKYFDVFMNDIRVYDDVIATLTFLSPWIKLGLLTNAVDAIEQNSRIRNSGLMDYFEVIAISGEIGYYKPDRRAFDWVSDNLKTKNSECLFIGDSEKHDITGAKQAGMRTAKKIYNTEETQADYFFANYNDLITLLPLALS